MHACSLFRRGAHPRLFTTVMLAGLAALLTGCQTPSMKSNAWRESFREQLPVLGHRNWVVIADSAYPEQVSPGVVTTYTGAGQVEVVREVLTALEGVRHVQPIVHVDAELDSVPEALAPGVEVYRSELKALLKGRRVVSLPHEELIAKLDEAGRTFRVLILKTDLAIPYTSVFLQLDCGYWGPEQERQLREALQRAGR